MKETINILKFACKEFEEDLVLYYYRDGSPWEQRRVERHIASCMCCRAFLDDLRRLLPQTNRAKEPAPAFWDHYYRETMEKLARLDGQRAWWRNLFQPMRGWVVPALSTAAAAVLALGLLFGNVGWNLKTSAPSRDKIPQELLTDTGKLEFFKSMDLLESLSMLEKLEGPQAEGAIVRPL